MGHNSHIDFELSDAVQDLVDEGFIEEGTAAFGVAQKVIHDGYKSLSAKQKAVYDSVVGPALEKRSEQLKLQRLKINDPD